MSGSLLINPETQMIEGTVKDLSNWAEGAEWLSRFPNFKPEEVASPDVNIVRVYAPAMSALQKLRDKAGRPLAINSAYRTPARNAAVGGSPTSQHLRGRAFDISLLNAPPVVPSSLLGETVDAWSERQYWGDTLQLWAQELGFTAVGRYDTFIHIDMREPKPSGELYYWDMRT